MEKKYKILIIDDSNELLSLYALAFREAKYEVYTASDGRKGFELALSELPDIILCDIIMPKYDGFYFLKKAQKYKILSDIVKITLTNLDNPEDRNEAERLGTDDYIVKTIYTPNELVKKISEILYHKLK